MIDKLMERYDALGCINEYPANYAAQWARLALDFAIDGRYAMSAKCRHKAEHYSQVKIGDQPCRVVGKMTIQKAKRHRVIYLQVA